MAKEEKKRPKNLQRLDDYNTLRRETKGFQQKKFPPPEFSVKENLTYAAKQGVKKAKKVGEKVVKGAKNMGAKAGKALKTLQNPTAAKKALEERKAKREGKAYGGKVKKMAKGGKLPMVKKDGKMVPAFAADGVGKMAYGGKVKKMADGGELGRKIQDAKPLPMPKATPKTKKPKYNPKKILEEYRKKTGSSPSRRIASGGKVKKMAYGGSVKKTGARRGDGCAVKGKTKGRMV